MTETIIYNRQNLTVHKCTGELIQDEILDTAKSFFDGSHTLYVIWDFSSAGMSDILPQAIRQLANISLKQGTGRAGGKTAIVAPTDSEQCLSKILHRINKSRATLFETRVFMSLEEAKQWLLSKG
jgi:hypothetical protein